VNQLWPALLGVVIGTAAPWPLKALWHALRGSADRDDRDTAAALDAALGEIARHVRRISDLEELVDLLRRALDKSLIRESAIASACELLIAVAKLVPKPSPAMLHMRDRAQQLLEDAQARTTNINRGDTGL
jgi:hypothetical protein